MPGWGSDQIEFCLELDIRIAADPRRMELTCHEQRRDFLIGPPADQFHGLADRLGEIGAKKRQQFEVVREENRREAELEPILCGNRVGRKRERSGHAAG
jgi:hypothetical protein